jgi:hypothetical protein
MRFYAKEAQEAKEIAARIGGRLYRSLEPTR